jgi:hypothetical protein
MRLAGLLRHLRRAVGSADWALGWADDGRPQVMPACQTGAVSGQETAAICSARGCRAVATWAVVWNNPRLHTPDREKVWVACDEHKQPLADYLAVRSFLKRVEPLETAS